MPPSYDSVGELVPVGGKAISLNEVPGSGSKTRFVGKHSRDHRLSIFIHRRNVNGYEAPGKAGNEILGLVRVNPDAQMTLQRKGLVVMVGVLARLLCDYGLQYTEQYVYQRETAIYPHGKDCDDEIEMVHGQLGDAQLPNDFHRGFRIKLPANLPPSTIFLSLNTSMSASLAGDSPWGMTYYLYAYVTDAATAAGTSMARPLIPAFSTRKSSKVFLSFTRSLVSDEAGLVERQTPPSQRVSKTLMPTNRPVSLDAALDRPFVYSGDLISLHVKINNPKGAKISGLRVTVKQLITTRPLNQSKQTIKVPLGTYEYRYLDENGKFIGGDDGRSALSSANMIPVKEYPFIVDTLRIPLKVGNFIQQAAVESRLPRSSMRTLTFCPSFSQVYEFQDNPLKYFSVEYYMNVHVIVPWGSDLIAKLPFTVASRGIEVSDEDAADDGTLSQWKTQRAPGDLDARDQAAEAEPEAGDPENDFDLDFNRRRHNQPPQSSEERNLTIKSFPRARLVLELERLQKQIDGFRSSAAAASSSPATFENSRRTLTREVCEAAQTAMKGIETLAALASALCNEDLREQKSVFVPSPMDANCPAELAAALKTQFIPSFRHLAALHTPEHREALLEALNLTLDTLELTVMKCISAFKDPVAVGDEEDADGAEVSGLLRDRLPREFLKLLLVIPGMMEWRWLLEGLMSCILVGFSSDAAGSGVAAPFNVAPINDMSPQQLNLELAKSFQSLHSRLITASSSIDPQELVDYARLLVSVAGLKLQGIKAHYRYFRKALFLHYAPHPSLLLPFEDERLKAVLSIDTATEPNDLKELRSQLEDLRKQLISTMMDGKD